MIEIRIRRPCSETQEPRTVVMSALEGVACPECHAYTLKRNRVIDHEPVEEWISIEEFIDTCRNQIRMTF